MREALRRQRMIIVSILVLTVLKVYVTQSVITEVYEARTAIVVPIDRNGTEQPASEIHVLRSRQLLGEVVDAVGLQAFNPTARHADRLIDRLQLAAQRGLAWAHGQYDAALIALDLKQRLNERDRALAFLERALMVESHDNTGVVVLRLRMADPATAVKVQEILLERYQIRRGLIRQSSQRTVPTERDIERLRESLARAEEDLKSAQHAAPLEGRATDGAAGSAPLLAELDERRRRAEQNYLTSLKRQNDAATGLGSDVRPITIATAPAASLEPVYPRKLLVMAMAIMAGLLCGIAVAGVREWMSDAVRDGSRLELATGLVCFGSFTDRRTLGADGER
jgi:uncharacterized protein involved in exopolysaccharide biosynthesis